MHSCDIKAWIWEGELYCADHKPICGCQDPANVDVPADECDLVSPVFADAELDPVEWCGQGHSFCGSCGTPGEHGEQACWNCHSCLSCGYSYQHADDCVPVGLTGAYVEAAVAAYEECADFTDTDQLARDAADEHGIDVIGFADETVVTFRADMLEFLRDVAAKVVELNPRAVGHDFWLTRNGHGAGFWDGDYPDDLGRDLTKAAKVYGSCELYIGDDGLIYA